MLTQKTLITDKDVIKLKPLLSITKKNLLDKNWWIKNSLS